MSGVVVVLAGFAVVAADKVAVIETVVVTGFVELVAVLLAVVVVVGAVDVAAVAVAANLPTRIPGGIVNIMLLGGVIPRSYIPRPLLYHTLYQH